MSAQKDTKEKSITAIFAIGLAGVILFNIIIVLRGTIEAFHSDSATAILLAHEQMLTGQLIPDGWHYANDVWVFTLNLFCIPFMLFVKNWLLCRELAVILQMLITTSLIVVYGRKLTDLKWGILAATLFWCPISVVTREHFLFQATYATIILQIVLLMIGIEGLFRNKGKKAMWYGILLGVVSLVVSMEGIRFIGATVAPIVVSIGLLLLFNVDFDLFQLIKGPYRTILLKLFYFAFMCILGYIMHLRIRAGGAISGYSMTVIDDTKIWEKIGNLFQYHMKVWGCFDTPVFFSINGILGFLRFVACVIMNIFVPVYVLIRYKHFENIWVRFFILYSIFTAIVCDYLLVFTNMYNDYYLLPIYFNQCILSVVTLWDLMKRKRNMVLSVAILCVIPFCLMHGLYFSTRVYSKGESDFGLLEILKENELYFGCSGIFWDAYKYTVLSDGEVEVVSYVDQPEKRNLWLCSEKWYEPDYYTGKSFILVRDEWVELSEEWKALAQEVIPYEGFYIYVYPENIYKMIDH